VRHGENEVRLQALHRAPPQQPTPSVVKLEGGPAVSVKPGQKGCVRSSGIAGSLHTYTPIFSYSVKIKKLTIPFSLTAQKLPCSTYHTCFLLRPNTNDTTYHLFFFHCFGTTVQFTAHLYFPCTTIQFTAYLSPLLIRNKNTYQLPYSFSHCS
jgi:hypothetical protein